LGWNLPLTADGLDVGVANEVHGQDDLFGARRKEVLFRGWGPRRVER
jgi:hypothetical protein